jgi:hypothetical protein
VGQKRGASEQASERAREREGGGGGSDSKERALRGAGALGGGARKSEAILSLPSISFSHNTSYLLHASLPLIPLCLFDDPSPGYHLPSLPLTLSLSLPPSAYGGEALILSHVRVPRQQPNEGNVAEHAALWRSRVNSIKKVHLFDLCNHAAVCVHENSSADA